MVNSFFGRIGPGLVADYVGRFNMMIVLGLLSTGLIFALWIPGNSVSASIAFSVIFGFTSGCTISLGPLMIFQISELRLINHNLSILYAAQSIVALVVSPMGGAFLGIDNGHGLLYLQIFGGAIMALGTTLLIVARIEISGYALWKKT